MISHVVFDHDGTLVNTSQYPKSLFEGIKELLRHLKSQGIKLYVWTARDRRSTLEILKTLDILDQFEDISTASDGHPKPNPDGLEVMLFDIDPKSVVIVGDSYTDILGAKHFGCTSIGVIWIDPNDEDGKASLEHFEADHICSTVSECKKVLDNLIKKGKNNV